MPLFPSTEWMQEFCAHVRTHPDVDNVAQALDGTYRFVVEPGGPLNETHEYDVRIVPGPSVTLLEEPVDQPTLQLIATHDRWRQLIKGQLDVGMAVMLRRLKVRGDLSKLLGRLDNAKPLTEALGQVQTEWRDE